MKVLDDELAKKQRTLRPKWYNFLPYKEWKVCWLHMTLVTFLSFSFLLPIYFGYGYDGHLEYLFFAIVIELGLFWRYVGVVSEVIYSCLLACFWLSFFIIITAWLFPLFNAIVPYDWMQISGPYQMEEKTMTHVAVEASIIGILFTFWSLLPFSLKRIWEHYYTLNMWHLR